jgi:mRNA interferase RelE/StbE
MPYRVNFRASADKAMDGLPRNVQARILQRAQRLAEDPRPPGCVKLTGQEKLWRVRVGDYRIVYEINDDAETVTITIVAHRRESYRGL